MRGLTPTRAILRFHPETQEEELSIGRTLQRLGVAALGGVFALAVSSPVRAQQPAVLSAQLYDQIHRCLGFYDGARELLIRNESHAANAAKHEEMIHDTEVALSSIAEAADRANNPRYGFDPAAGDARIAQARAELDAAASKPVKEQFELMQARASTIGDCEGAMTAIEALPSH